MLFAFKYVKNKYIFAQVINLLLCVKSWVLGNVAYLKYYSIKAPLFNNLDLC